MIIGIGNDLAEVERIRASLENPRTGERFRDRVFTPGEQAYCERRGEGRYQSYAVRFAAKEAVMKALGTGWGIHTSWRDIEVMKHRKARPEIILHGRAQAFADTLGIERFHLTLSHTADLAQAQVVAEGAEP